MAWSALVGILLVFIGAGSATGAESERVAARGGPVETMVVSAAHTPLAVDGVPRFTTVLDGEDLANGVSTSLADALRFVPGLQITQEGARGGRAAISLRGLDPNHVVVLVDGVRLNDPTNQRGGSFDPTTLALADIERVEVIRGSLSSVYGSDALAGVIHIITRAADPEDEPSAELTGRGGRFHTGQVAGRASSGIGGVAGLTLGASLDTFRDPSSDGGYDGLSTKARVDADLPFGVAFTGSTRIHASSSRSFPQFSGGPERAPIRDLEDRDVREISVGVRLERELGSWGAVELRASRFDRREDRTSPGVAAANPASSIPPSRAGDEYERWEAALVSTTRLPALELGGLALGSRLTTGVDGIWEDGESDTYLDFVGGPLPFPFFETRRTLGVFADLEESIGPWITASAGLRLDHSPDGEDRLLPSAGLTIDLPRVPWLLFGSYAEGFKRPSFFALGEPTVGDPTLVPERSQSWELGVRGRLLEDRLFLQLAYFDIEVEALIDFDNSGLVPALVNRGRLVSRGVELEVDWRPVGWLGTRAGVTFNPTDFGGTSLAPQNRSRWRGFLELRASPLPSIEAQLRVLAVSSVKASSFQTGDRVVTLAGYERVDVRVAWRPRPAVELFVEIENLTDRTYRDAVGFEAPGIAPRAGVTLRL